MWTTRQASKFSGGLALSRTGTGPAVLFIHGVGLRSESWNAVIAHMKTDFQYLTLDLPGHGQSKNAIPEIVDITTLTDFIRGSLPAPPEFIVGHSLGALIAADYAIRYPAGLKAAAAMNTIFQRSETSRRAVMQRAEDLKTRGSIDPTVTLKRWFGNTNSPERTACDQWLRSNRTDQYAKFYGIFARSSGVDPAGLSKLNVPVLFITGALEPNSTPAMTEAMAKISPMGHGYIVDDAAHMAPMTHAGEIAAEIKGFFHAYG